MITVTGLTKHYGDRTAVDDLTFTVAAGRVTGFVGHREPGPTARALDRPRRASTGTELG